MAIVRIKDYYLYGGGRVETTKLTMTNSTLTEDSSPVGTIVSTYTLTPLGNPVTVDFRTGTNTEGYYELVSRDVLLTQVGFDALNIGTVMPNVSLSTSDGINRSNFVTTVLVDDETLLTLTNGTVVQGTTVAGDVVCTFTASDEDDTLTFDFTEGTNVEGYYAIDGFNVLLTIQGESFLNEGNEMPNVSITTNTRVTSSNTVTTELTPEELRWYWNMTSPSYVSFPTPLNIVGAFSHKFTGKFSSNSFHLLSNQNGADFRVFLSGASYNLFAGVKTNPISVVSLGREIRQSLEVGVHTLEYGRDNLGEWFVKIDDVSVGSTVNLYSSFMSYNTFGSQVSESSVSSFGSYHWDHEITGVSTIDYPTGELAMPFDEGYNDEHESRETSNNLIITKVGDTPDKYTQEDPDTPEAPPSTTLLQPATTTDYPVDVVSLGASILTGSYSVASNITEFKRTAALGGLNVTNFYDYAIGGYTTTDTLTKSLPLLLSERADTAYKTKVLLHTIGNNVSQNGPYPGGSSTIESELTEIIEQLQGAGFEVLPLMTSFRTPPASNPTEPYNTNILLPIFTDLCPNTVYDDGVSALDFYTFTKNVTAQYQTDGIHYNSTGYFQNASWMGTVASVCVKAGTDETADPNYEEPVPISSLIIDLGSGISTATISSVPSNGSLTNARDANGDLAAIGLTSSGFGRESNESGKSYAGVGYVIDNTSVTRDSFYVPDPSFVDYVSGTSGQIDFSGTSIVDTDSYTITVGASRNVSDGNRSGTITIGGVSKVLNAADLGSSSYPTISFEGVTGAEIKSSGINVARTNTSSAAYFAYIGAIKIDKE